MYDIIGDVHGYAGHLKNLFKQLGYNKTESGYSHTDRKAIFVGDFVNRGPEIRKTIRLIREMVENGNAYAVLGNHEINTIIYHLKDTDGRPLIKSPNKNFLSLHKTISQFAGKKEEWKDHLKWMRKLPLWLDLGEIRVVHACWSDKAIEVIQNKINEGISRKSLFREFYKTPDSELSKSIEILTKGIDFRLPGDLRISNNKGVSPREFRMRWWDNPEGKTFEQVSFESKFSFPDYDIPSQVKLPEFYVYGENNPPVFFGHYCRFDGPFVIKPNLCCIDSCVAGSKVLTAYCWNGEKVLNSNNLIQIRG